MAENSQDNSPHTKNTAGSRPSSATREDRELRIKSFKERQNQERQKKLEEMKSQALAAQRFKEQKETERRQRLDELRVKEDERRLQVEERKKAINDAERDRLESILKRNQEREARIEAKRKNERSSLVFAFGSSTPRVLGPADGTTTSFWGHRRATSTQNIPYSATPLTRRQSERELDSGSKKRATSAGGLERSGNDMRMSTSVYGIFKWGDESESSNSLNPTSPTQANLQGATPPYPAGCVSGYVGRRRTDLMPTIPTKESASTTPRKPFMRSPAPSRPSSSLSQQSTSSVTSSVILRNRPVAAPRRQRPASIAGTGISSGDLKNAVNDLKRQEKPPLPRSFKSASTKSTEKISKRKSLNSSVEGSPRTIASSNATPVNTTANGSVVQSPSEEIKSIARNDVTQSVNATEIFKNVNTNEEDEFEVDEVQDMEIIRLSEPLKNSLEKEEFEAEPQEIDEVKEEQLINIEVGSKSNESVPINNKVSEPDTIVPIENLLDISNNEVDMSASFSSKPRITTEEEAKAALAERRRLAREEAERQAECERLRVEEERRVELERQQKEEEQQRQLIELQRQMEEERLREAIREAQKREEELKLKQEEEQRLKLLKEEADKKAKEEAEKQKAELQERLKNEEKEREARRKRVEAIMLRTRGKNNSTNTAQTDEKNAENKLDSNIINGSNKTTDMAENGHKNGKDLEMVDNIISINTIKNANTVSATTLHTEDTVNSNDAWQRNSQTDLLM